MGAGWLQRKAALAVISSTTVTMKIWTEDGTKFRIEMTAGSLQHEVKEFVADGSEFVPEWHQGPTKIPGTGCGKWEGKALTLSVNTKGAKFTLKRSLQADGQLKEELTIEKGGQSATAVRRYEKTS